MGLTEDQLQELRQSFNHFDKVRNILVTGAERCARDDIHILCLFSPEAFLTEIEFEASNSLINRNI